uniref:MARVEL domain-containing protein n=1 Tax=Rhabditophanes sp. KR3021 TaxID=114890 RepID=A0AC35U4W5_9BILA
MSLLGNFDLQMLKVPLGFIKVLQFPFVLIAFTAMDGWGFLLEYTCSAKNGTEPFVQKALVDKFALSSNLIPNCNGTQLPLWDMSYGGTATLFGLLALSSLIFVMAMLFIYLMNLETYVNDNRYAHADCIVTAALAIVWFLVAVSWWSVTSNVVEATSNASIVKLLNEKHFCGNSECLSQSYSHSSPLLISVLSAWACAILFVGNIWFTYKETDWFKNRQPFPEPQMNIEF